ncbi:MAG: MFS transporter [Acidobacteria bacterium]|nr:MFS transporter [Acidobacteriota bacterium]
MQNTAEEKTGGFYAWYALAILMVVYIFNFLDRQVIYILFGPIKTEMAFSDTQLALLGATSFAIFYTLLGIPFGRLADRRSRTRLIAVGLAVWSIFSGLTGFAGGFWTLFACRVMVGVGEATLGPAAISLLADYFAPSRRATVSSIYSMGIAIGAGLAALVGGALIQYGWRNAFFIVGFPGLLLAVLVFLMREPARTAPAAAVEPGENAGDWRGLIGNRSFLLLCLGYGFFGLATNNISVWGPTYFDRVFGIKPAVYGYWAGIVTMLAGIPATLLGGIIADWFRRRSGGGRMLYGALLSLVSIPCWLLVLFTDNFADHSTLVIGCGVVLLFAGLGWLGAAAADATEIAGPSRRGLAVAIYFFTVNIAAYLIGANVIGKISDLLGSAQNPAVIKYALLVCPVCCLLGALCLWLGSRSLDK